MLDEPDTTDDHIRLMLKRETAIPLGLLEEGVSVRSSLTELLRLLTMPEVLASKPMALALDRIEPSVGESHTS